MVKFDLDDAGAILFVVFRSPTEKEISQFKSGVDYDIRFVEAQDIITMLFKFGSLNWIDAPYTPHLSPNLTALQRVNRGQGLSLLVVLCDSATGIIKYIRTIGLNEDFTNEFFYKVAELKSKSYDVSNHAARVRQLQSMYTTEQLVKMSESIC